MVKYEFAEQTRDRLIEMGATNVVLNHILEWGIPYMEEP